MKNQYMQDVRKNVGSILMQALALGMLLYDWRLSAGLILLDIFYISVYTVMQVKKEQQSGYAGDVAQKFLKSTGYDQCVGIP